MSADTMLELAGRAKSATGADRALDADIRLLIHGDCIFGALTDKRHQWIGHAYLSGYVEQYRDLLTSDDAIPDEIVSRYTASADAAMTLRLPNMRARIVVGQNYASCELISGWGRARERCIVPTIERADEEIALCIVAAWLRARAAMERPA